MYMYIYIYYIYIVYCRSSGLRPFIMTDLRNENMCEYVYICVYMQYL